MRICAYRGYATPTRVFVCGRVLSSKSPRELRGDEGLCRNLLNTYRRIATTEVPHVAVTVQLAADAQSTRTDREGYYHAEVARSSERDQLWLTATARCQVRGAELSAEHEIVAPGPDAEFGIISDLDDTVIETNMTSLLTAAKLTFIGNAKTRKPLEGVAALYASLQNGRAGRPVNPIFYVSTSPWNLYDLLCDFMDLNQIPRGPLFLRDWGMHQVLGRAPGHAMKLERALKIMADFPQLPFVLVGDSGQHDAGVYAQVAAQHPERVKAIYIRDVDPSTASRRDDEVRAHIRTATSHGVPMLLATNSEAMAEHAAEIGLIPARVEAEVKLEVAKDQERPTLATVAAKEVLGIDSGQSG